VGFNKRGSVGPRNGGEGSVWGAEVEDAEEGADGGGV
jgi:hypothetical protein